MVVGPFWVHRGSGPGKVAHHRGMQLLPRWNLKLHAILSKTNNINATSQNATDYRVPGTRVRHVALGTWHCNSNSGLFYKQRLGS
jgi:hypothetical protein